LQSLEALLAYIAVGMVARDIVMLSESVQSTELLVAAAVQERMLDVAMLSGAQQNCSKGLGPHGTYRKITLIVCKCAIAVAAIRVSRRFLYVPMQLLLCIKTSFAAVLAR
jgi:hypothetical protein